MTLSCDPVLIRSGYGHARDRKDKTAATAPNRSCTLMRAPPALKCAIVFSTRAHR
jgi:hypothetical protein